MRTGPHSGGAGAPPLFTLSGPFSVGMIWAESANCVIGAEGTLAWHIPEDLAHFRAVTRGYAVLHGRASYESIPAKFRPLPGRRNLVLTRDRDYCAPGAEVVHSLAEAEAVLAGAPVWVVGGGQVYEAAMTRADALVVTEVDLEVPGDTYAPAIDAQAWQQQQVTEWITSSTGIAFRILEYRRRAWPVKTMN